MSRPLTSPHSNFMLDSSTSETSLLISPVSIPKDLNISLNYYISYMNKRSLITKLEPILSNKEIEVVIKRLNNKHITQTESNYLSRSIRPKLRSAEFVASTELRSLLNYRRKKYEQSNQLLRKKILKATRNIINNTKAIIVFGSYIKNSHTNYRDIDVMIVLNKKLWKSLAEKHRLKVGIEKAVDIKIDIHLAVYNELMSLLPYSPLLQTELEDHKVIYGNIKLRKKIIINKDYLYRKLLEAEYAIELGMSIKSKYIYNAIRNCLAIELFLKKIVNNNLIMKTIENNIGKSTANSLMDDKANLIQREIALKYLQYLYDKLIESLK